MDGLICKRCRKPLGPYSRNLCRPCYRAQAVDRKMVIAAMMQGESEGIFRRVRPLTWELAATSPPPAAASPTVEAKS